MIYKLIILTASIFMIYEFTKKRSTAVAQIEPIIQANIKRGSLQTQYVDTRIIQANINAGVITDQTDIYDIQTIYNNEQSFKKWFSDTFNMAKRGSIFTNGVLDPIIVHYIQKNDTAYFQWRNSINRNAWLKLQGV
jgi:hypothetical protein